MNEDAEHAVRTFAGRQQKLNALARVWLQLPQTRDSSAPVRVAIALVREMEENLAHLVKALR